MGKPTGLVDERAFEQWSSLFDRDAVKILDIGCGSGQFLLNSAQLRPEADHLGIELNRPLVQKAADLAATSTNIRFLNGDAVALLNTRFPAHFLDEIHLYHPQPYLDPLENAYGMLTPAFLERVWIVLKPGGLFFLQTDSRPYAKYLLEAVPRHFQMELQVGPWPDAPEGRTLREGIAMRKRLSILRMRATPRTTPLDLPTPVPYFERGGIRSRHVRRKPGDDRGTEAAGTRFPTPRKD